MKINIFGKFLNHLYIFLFIFLFGVTCKANDKIIKMGTKKTGSTATTNPVETVPVPQELYVEEPTPTTNPIEETPQVEEPVTTTPVEETPATTTEQPNGSNNQWPTGWDTPENPNYKG